MNDLILQIWNLNNINVNQYNKDTIYKKNIFYKL